MHSPASDTKQKFCVVYVEVHHGYLMAYHFFKKWYAGVEKMEIQSAFWEHLQEDFAARFLNNYSMQ